jgi:endonuclease/exonuclease/phosphatase family metal-dependent hydrolase
MQLRVLTLNIQNDEGSPRRIALINEEIRRLDPDLLSLQEVKQRPGHSQLAELLDGTPLHGTHQADVMATSSPWADQYGGSAVATRWPHRVAEALDLRLHGATDVPWATLAVTVPLPGEGDMLFIGASSSWRLSAEAARERQAVALTELDDRHRTELPTVIAGDFNAVPDSASIRYLTGLAPVSGHSVCYHDAWAVAGDGPGYTWTSANASARQVIDQIVGQPSHQRRIDYIFVGSWDAHPQAHAHIRAVQLAFNQPAGDGLWPSDHFGVLAILEIGRDT